MVVVDKALQIGYTAGKTVSYHHYLVIMFDVR